jgi:DNA-binding beta-propeller fold protein YncE
MKKSVYALLALALLSLSTLTGEAKAQELLFTLGYNNIEAVNTETDDIVADIPVPGFVRELIWTSDKKSIYATTNRHAIVEIDVATLKVVRTFDTNVDGWKRCIWGFVIANDNKTAYINSIDRKVEGDQVLVRRTIDEIDLKDGKVLRSMTPPWGVSCLVYLKDGKTLYALGQDLYKVDIANAKMEIVETTAMFDQKKNILPIWHFTLDNGGIFMSNYYTPQYMGLLSIDTNTGQITDRVVKGVPPMAYSFSYSPDKKKAYGIMEDLTVVDLEGNAVVKSFPNAEGTSYAALPSADGKKLYVGAGGSTIAVYDTENWNLLKVLQMNSDSVSLAKMNF